MVWLCGGWLLHVVFSVTVLKEKTRDRSRQLFLFNRLFFFIQNYHSLAVFVSCEKLSQYVIVVPYNIDFDNTWMRNYLQNRFQCAIGEGITSELLIFNLRSFPLEIDWIQRIQRVNNCSVHT